MHISQANDLSGKSSIKLHFLGPQLLGLPFAPILYLQRNDFYVFVSSSFQWGN